MKRLVVLLLLAAMLLPACGAPPEAAPTAPPTTAPTEVAGPADTPVPEPTATPPPQEVSPTPEPTAAAVLEEASPTPVPTSGAQPTATSVPTTPPQPTATPTTGPVVVFRDDFNGALASGWSWVREDPTHWNLTGAPGYLRIILQAGSGPPRNNLLWRDAPVGKFEIATLVRFTPASNFQFARLLICQDDANCLQFGRAFAGHFVGNGIYFDNIRDNEWGDSNYASETANKSLAYLKLVRAGTSYTGYYSEDGTNWIYIGQHTSSITPSHAGLLAAQAMEAETTADFDYFTITTLP